MLNLHCVAPLIVSYLVLTTVVKITAISEHREGGGESFCILFNSVCCKKQPSPFLPNKARHLYTWVLWMAKSSEVRHCLRSIQEWLMLLNPIYNRFSLFEKQDAFFCFHLLPVRRRHGEVCDDCCYFSDNLSVSSSALFLILLFCFIYIQGGVHCLPPTLFYLNNNLVGVQ